MCESGKNNTGNGCEKLGVIAGNSYFFLGGGEGAIYIYGTICVRLVPRPRKKPLGPSV